MSYVVGLLIGILLWLSFLLYINSLERKRQRQIDIQIVQMQKTRELKRAAWDHLHSEPKVIDLKKNRDWK